MDNNNMNQPGTDQFQNYYQQPADQTQNTYQQNTYQSGAYQQPSPVYSQPQMMYQQPANDEIVTIGNWLLSFLILCIPCVNIIMVFVWAFSGSTPKSKSNFFKAYLIMVAISLVLGLIFTLIAGGAFMDMMYDATRY